MTGRRPGEPIDVPSRGRAAPLDITGITGTDDLVEALSTRRFAPSEDDPAVRLLQSLIADVDQGAPPLPAGRPVAPVRGSVRRGARTVVVLGVTTALLATTSVAAAGNGGLGGSLIRSAIVAKQVTALHSRAELKSVCQAVMEGWYGPGRGTRNRVAFGRTAPGTARSARPVRKVDRPFRERTFGVRSPLWQDRGDRAPADRTEGDQAAGDRIEVRIWPLRRGTQGLARPSSLSITPST